MFMVSFHNIMPTILLLDFGANNVRFGHIPVVKIVDALPENKCLDSISIDMVLSVKLVFSCEISRATQQQGQWGCDLIKGSQFSNDLAGITAFPQSLGSSAN